MYRVPTTFELELLSHIYAEAGVVSPALKSQLEGCEVEEVPDWPYDLRIRSTGGLAADTSEQQPSIAQYLDDDDMPVMIEPFIDENGRVSYLEVGRIDGERPHIGPMQARMLHFSRQLRDGERTITREIEDRILAAESHEGSRTDEVGRGEDEESPAQA